jgi:hypothetical protein
MDFERLGNQTAFVFLFLQIDDLSSLARTCTTLWDDTIQYITKHFTWLQRLQPRIITIIFANQRLFDFASTHENIMNSLSRHEQFVIRQVVTLGPKNDDGSGIREEGPTRAIRKTLHELATIFNCLSRTVKHYNESKEDIIIGCNCCCSCCCTCFFDNTDEDEHEPPYMGVLVREDNVRKTYIVYESDAVFYICVAWPHRNPKKNRKALGCVTRPVRFALWGGLQCSRDDIPYPVHEL